MEQQDRGIPSVFTLTLIQLGVGVVLFVALLYGQQDLIVLTLLVLGVIGGLRLWARLSLSGLKYHLGVDREKIFPDEPVTLTVGAENGKPLPVWLEIWVPINLLQTLLGESVLRQESSLLWFQRTQWQWKLTAGRRGVYQIGPVHILAGDLFSFFSRHQRTQEMHSIVVYPRLVPLKSFSLPKRDFFGVPRASSPVQDPIYILGTRDYTHGQPSKYIHWKASARRNRLQEKLFEPTVQEKVLLVVDVGSFADGEAEQDFERVLQVAASMAVRLDQQGHSVGLVANGVTNGGGLPVVPVTRNDRQLPAILEVMARLEMKPERDIKDLLRRGLADAWGVSCVYFSNQADEGVLSARRYLIARHTPALFFACHPTSITDADRSEIDSKIYGLDDICAAEVENR
ncbi:MAG TPA: DUF58 domain-containing protein [Anaerolineae bacterium]